MQPVIEGQYFLMDRTLKSVSYFNASPAPDSICVYEVFRIERFKPLFINEHLERFKNTLKIAGLKPHLNIEGLRGSLNLLFSANNIENGNVKLDFRQMPSGESQFMAYFIQTNYPGENELTEGVKCALQFSERHHPEAKIYNPEVRDKADAIIEQQHIYETLLVNSENYLTEGSRSNLFFIKDYELITAGDTLVLPGIIRHKVIDLAKELNIPITYRTVHIDELNSMDAAFITGTTPRMLSISRIAEITYPISNSLFMQLRDTLLNLIEEEINS